MKRLLWLIPILLSVYPQTAQAQSTLATVSAGMSPGTWREFTEVESSFTAGMVGGDDGGIDYVFNAQWDAQHHVGYFWSGVHSSANVCYHNVVWTTLATSMAGDTTVTKGTGDTVFDSSLIGKTLTISSGTNFVAGDYTILSVGGSGLNTTGTLDRSPSPTGAGSVGQAIAHPWNEVGCADVSQFFFKYDDTANAFALVPDAITGHNNSATVPSDVGGHPLELHALDPNGFYYRMAVSNSTLLPQRFNIASQTWSQFSTNMFSVFAIGTNGFSWFPEANGLITAFGFSPTNAHLYFLPRDGSSWQTVGGKNCTNCTSGDLTWGPTLSMALYNPIKHELLAGSGAGGCTGPSGFCDTDADSVIPRTYNTVTYSAGTFVTSSDKRLPFILQCNGSSLFVFDASSQNSIITVDPVSGKYIVIARTPGVGPSTGCDPVLYSFDSSTGTLTPLTGTGHAPPATVLWPGANAGGTEEAVSIPEYGVIMYVSEKGSREVWLYKPDTVGGGNPPSTPANLVSTGQSATSVELMWNAATPGTGGVLSGYRIYRDGLQIAQLSSTQLIYNLTGLTPNTMYGFQVSAIDTDGTEGTLTSALDITTDTALLSYTQKCALTGVVMCDGVDSEDNINYYWDVSGASGGTGTGNPCNVQLRDTLGKTNHVTPSPQFTGYANAQAIVNFDAAGNPRCDYEYIDTTVKHSGAGSLLFPSPPYCGVPCSGEYYEVMHKYSNNSFGFIAPQNTVFPCNGPSPANNDIYCHGVHLGDVLWMQWYLRADSNFLGTAYNAALYAGSFQTASAGATTVDIYACLPELPPNSAGQNPAPLGIADGNHHFFFFGLNRGFVPGQYLITGISANGCHITVDRSPSPQGTPGADPVTGGGGTYPNLEDGFIDGGNTSNTAIKNLGVFGDPPHNSCCLSAFQAALDNYQNHTPAMYSYGPFGSVNYQNAGYTVNGVSDFYNQTRPGCIFTGGFSDIPGTRYPEPPCIRYHPDQWQEFTMRLDLAANGYVNGCNTNGHYTLWIDAQVVQDRQDFTHCWGYVEGGDVANGLGQFNFSYYMTGKDPNQNYPAGKWWIDDIIVSTNPIPMLASGAPVGLLINTTSLPNGVNGTAYSTTPTASGGTAPYAWSVLSGSLPTGLMLDPVFGTISGTPTANGMASFTLRATDSVMATADQALSITINAIGSPVITTSSPLPSGTVGSAYSQTLAATGGTSPYTWSVLSGNFPGGLTLSGAGGITGTPTVAQTFNFTIRATDSAMVTADKNFSLTIASGISTLSITTMTLPSGTAGSPYSAPLAATGGVPPYIWDVPTTGSSSTLGYTNLGVGTTEMSPQLLLATGPFTASDRGTATAVRLQCGTGASPLTIGVYDDSGGSPGLPNHLLFQTANVTPCGGADSLVSIPITGSIGAATTYWLGIATSGGLNGIRFDGPSAGRGRFASITYSGGNLPTTFPSSNAYGYDITMYLEVSGSGSGGTLPAGLSLTTNGTLVGTPTTAGTSPITIRVTDSQEQTAQQTYSLQIRENMTSVARGKGAFRRE